MIQPGFALWLTGLPASGKTTIAVALARVLNWQNVHTQRLDSDQLRQNLTPEPTYSPAERDQFYRTLAHIAYLLTINGVPVIIAATGHKQIYRDRARRQIEQFVEIYVHCSLATCMARDEKGIYRQVQWREAMTVPGLQIPYEIPPDPEIVVDSEHSPVATCVGQIMTYLENSDLLSTRAR